jgi:hypothetical protein
VQERRSYVKECSERADTGSEHGHTKPESPETPSERTKSLPERVKERSEPTRSSPEPTRSRLEPGCSCREDPRSCQECPRSAPESARSQSESIRSGSESGAPDPGSSKAGNQPIDGCSTSPATFTGLCRAEAKVSHRSNSMEQFDLELMPGNGLFDRHSGTRFRGQ